MNEKIKIITNSLFLDLYEISKSFYINLPYEKLVVGGDNCFFGFDFLNYVVTNDRFVDVDIMIYIDEDCFIVDEQALQKLINHFIVSELDCVGMPDGGVTGPRSHNPVSINQFFCILNLREIRKKYDYKAILNTKYTNDLEKYTPFALLKTNFTYDDFEPYYKLFFWMLKNDFKFQYLDARYYSEDHTTTILKNHNNIEFAYHTWYAREWKNENHNIRIKKIIEHCNKIRQ